MHRNCIYGSTGFNFQNDRNGIDFHRQEWSRRTLDNSNGEPSDKYTNIAYIQMEFGKLTREKHFLCRAVANYSDNVLVKFHAEAEGTQLHITKHPDEKVNPEETAPTSCDLKFEVLEASNGYYWRCKSSTPESETGIHFRDCGWSRSAAY